MDPPPSHYMYVLILLYCQLINRMQTFIDNACYVTLNPADAPTEKERDHCTASMQYLSCVYIQDREQNIEHQTSFQNT